MTEKKAEKTPGPWKVEKAEKRGSTLYPPCVLGANGEDVCILGYGQIHCQNSESNAAYIVRACNSFPALVAALQEAEVSLFDGDDRQRKTWKTVADALESIGEL
jgi:hypothetical protein